VVVPEKLVVPEKKVLVADDFSDVFYREKIDPVLEREKDIKNMLNSITENEPSKVFSGDS
jgi:hypothetical protein